MNARHKLRPPRKCIIVLLDQAARLCIQRAVWVGLNQKTGDGDQHIAQCELRIPVALQRLHAHAAGLRLDVGMEDGRAEVGRRRLLRVIGRDAEMQLPYAAGIGGVRGSGEENIELGEIITSVCAG